MTRKAYKTDITEAQWQILEPLIPPAKTGGHPRTADMREVLDRGIERVSPSCNLRSNSPASIRADAENGGVFTSPLSQTTTLLWL